MTIPYRDLPLRVARVASLVKVTISTPRVSLAPFKAAQDLLHNIASPDLNIVTAVHPPSEGVEVVLTGRSGVGPVRFLGAPSGFELEGLVYAMECLAHPHEADLPAIDLRILQELPRPLAADLYVAPT